MSMAIWCALQNDPEDYYPDDLYCLLGRLDIFDRYCTEAGVSPLSELLDESDVVYNSLGEEELGDEDAAKKWLEEHARWLAPEIVLASVEALIKLTDCFKNETLEELTHIKERCLAAQKDQTQVRLLAVL